MEEHLKTRPKKNHLPQHEQEMLRKKAIEKITNELLPDDLIFKIVLIGSSIKGSFGIYENPGFRGSMYSDFDFIVFVEDAYEIPEWLTLEPDGKPFPDAQHNLAYRNKQWLDNTYDAEVFFVRRGTWENPLLQAQGEAAGIPLTEISTLSHMVIYSQ